MSITQIVVIYLIGYVVSFGILVYSWLLEFDEMDLGNVFIALIFSLFSWIGAVAGLMEMIFYYLTHTGIFKKSIFKRRG